ncbi:hypothetical protein BDZ94DRAFT_1308260 [Collybia nuda]|uniref:Polysaccharide lyase 14 domain-containing protein n=1 Tax=Collybia nuda TaxID=64659 RepID=A0A9P5Y885_9AGAR|nr:hypothetical protein BDZ94DRAFT_1308260 [Collybia nuda]
MHNPDISHLFPVAEFHSGFTTSSIQHEQVEHVEFEDHALGVHKKSPRTPHKIVAPPASKSPLRSAISPPEKAWEAFYPKGSINPAGKIPGGFTFHVSGPKEFAENLAHGAKEAVFSYRMMLEEGWEWVKGGKLPGIFGGVGDLSYSCTGGRQNDRCKCFNLRPMWRPNSVGELYTYLPLTQNNSKHLLAVPPSSKANPDYGFSVGRGSFHFDIAVGQWVAVAFRVKLNDHGKENGEIQIWIDGTSVILAKHLTICDSSDARIKGMHFQTFFGGHTEEWASPKDQRAWFADISGVIVK